MTKSEVKSILSLISECWKNSPDASPATLSVWSEMLGDIPIAIAKAAVKKLLLAGKPFSPSISEIRQVAVEITRPRFPTPAEAYEQATDFTDALTWLYGEKWWECLSWERMHPLARRVLGIIGIRSFAEGEASVIRGQFLKMYGQLLQREQEDAVLPLSFKQEVEALQAGQPALPNPNAEKARAMIEGLAKEKEMK